jgi:hypothetical protein
MLRGLYTIRGMGHQFSSSNMFSGSVLVQGANFVAPPQITVLADTAGTLRSTLVAGTSSGNVEFSNCSFVGFSNAAYLNFTSTSSASAYQNRLDNPSVLGVYGGQQGVTSSVVASVLLQLTIVNGTFSMHNCDMIGSASTGLLLTDATPGGIGWFTSGAYNASSYSSNSSTLLLAGTQVGPDVRGAFLLSRFMQFTQTVAIQVRSTWCQWVCGGVYPSPGVDSLVRIQMRSAL